MYIQIFKQEQEGYQIYNHYFKINNVADKRQDIMSVVDVFRAKITDYSPEALVIEIRGESSKINAFIELLEPYGIMEMCRTGLVALERGGSCLKDA